MIASPLVSIPIITYNHEKFIRKAIDSVLEQTTNFDYEIIVGDDCSTDNTRNILLDYLQKYPDKIKLILQEKNVGGNRNFIDTYTACKGKYIALLEGDDYWTDTNKLQKQVNFLDSNPGFVICYHDVTKVFDDDCVDADIIARDEVHKDISDINDLLNGNFIYTASCVFLKTMDGFPPWFSETILSDWLIYLLLTEHGGKIYHLKDKMAAYRIHSGGVYSTNNSMAYEKQVQINKGLIKQIEYQIEYFKDNYIKETFEKSLVTKINKLRILALNHADYKVARFASFKLMKLLIKQKLNYKLYASALLSYCAPVLHSKYLIKKRETDLKN